MDGAAVANAEPANTQPVANQQMGTEQPTNSEPANAEPTNADAGTAAESSSLPDSVAPVGGDPAEASTQVAPDLAACPAPPPVGDFPLDVAAVLMASCQHCHRDPPVNHAPFPLLNYEDVLTSFSGIPKWQDMYHVIQPGSVPHMPPSTAPPLTANQLQTLSNWLGACAVPVPEGTGGDADTLRDAASTGESDSGGTTDGG